MLFFYYLFFDRIFNMQYMDIGTLIKTRRKELNMTQEELCEGICEPVTISRIENGKQIPSTKHLKAILERLNLPTQQIICLVPQSIYRNYTSFISILDDLQKFTLKDNSVDLSEEFLLKEISKIDCSDKSSEQFQFLLSAFLQTIHSPDINLVYEIINEIKLTQPTFNESNFVNLY